MSRAAGALPDWLPVSRETHIALQDHLDLVKKWNPAINLVSQNSLADGWERHTLDSAQLWPIGATEDGPWLDIGSGAGFPGLVIAIIAKELAPRLRVVLVESDQRKSTFLAQATRQFNLNAIVHADRIEALEPIGAVVASARAVAQLDKLLQLIPGHLTTGGTALFPKGRGYPEELELAEKRWKFDCEIIPSRVESGSVVLKLSNIKYA